MHFASLTRPYRTTSKNHVKVKLSAMFTWICPKCGAEVPPSESDCPNCRSKATPPAARVEPVTASAPPPAHPVPTAVSYAVPASPVVPAPVAAAPPLPVNVAPPQIPARKPLSPVVVAIGSAVGIMALLAILYLYVLPHSSAKSTSTPLESPGTAASPAAATVHPLAKYIEITGVRVMEDKAGQAKVGYIIVNHSPADLPDLRANITLSAAGKPFFQFSAPIPSIGPYESKDLSTTVKTQLKPYELPDWQVLTPSFRITSN